MITTSIILNNHQIILLEFSAMAVAMWVYRESGWIRQPSKILFALSLTAVIGFVVNLLPISYVGKIGITCAFDAFITSHSTKPGTIYLWT